MSYCDLHQSVALRAFSSNFIISKRVIDWAKYFLASSLRHNSASAHALLYISRGSITKLPYLTQNATPSSQILYACSYSLLRASQLLISYTITGYFAAFCLLSSTRCYMYCFNQYPNFKESVCLRFSAYCTAIALIIIISSNVNKLSYKGVFPSN